jgi:hypothetical protein
VFSVLSKYVVHSRTNELAFESLDVYNHANFLGAVMKTLVNVISVFLILAGGTFFLQGINVLPGSYMTGDPQWAINGSVMIVLAIGLMLWVNRK